MNKQPCFLTHCQQASLPTQLYCLVHYLKFTNQHGYVRCSYCCRYQVPFNKNFYVQNRYYAQFWNHQEKNKFICFACLYDWQEIPVQHAKKPTYYNYKYRYYSNTGTLLTN